MEYTPDQKSELIKCFGKVGFQFIKDVDVIEQYFNKLQNLVRVIFFKVFLILIFFFNSKLKPVYIPEEITTFRNRIILDESFDDETFSIQQNSKGRCRITIFKENNYLIVANHLGDIESAKVKINGSIELIKKFRQFIEICCKLAADLEFEKNVDFLDFEVIFLTQSLVSKVSKLFKIVILNQNKK
jgi:hypothetical protein